MEDLVNYLDESLQQIELKAQEYLLIEEKLRQADIETESASHHFLPDNQPDNSGADQPTLEVQQGQVYNKPEEPDKPTEDLKATLLRLKQEIIGMLPEKNKFIDVDLGYGPSSIGAFTNKENPNELDLIIVH